MLQERLSCLLKTQKFGWIICKRYLITVIKRGARKAAATQQARKIALLDSGAQSDLNCEQNYCGLCGKEYVDEAETPELWIACDLCDMLYCGTCEYLTSVPEEEDTYICSKCA